MAAQATNGKATTIDDERWPTASAVAIKLGCSRQQVYKLEMRGKLRADAGKPKRFDPDSVRALLADSDALAQLLEVDLPGDDEDDDDTRPSNAMRLAAKVVQEARQVATDARRGQHEAYDLVAIPAREYTKLLMSALEQREKRIAELEEKLNRFYDEQRDSRAETQEAEFMRSRLEKTDARKDQFFKMFTDNLPVVLEQLKTSMSGGAGPFAEWMRKRSPAQQAKMILAIEAVIGEDQPPAAAGSSTAPPGPTAGENADA
jgi:hypothetical protein